MIRHLFPLALLFLWSGLSAQTEVTLTARVEGCSQPLQLFTFTGVGFEPQLELQAGEDGTYAATFTMEEPAFRYLGSGADDALPLIVGGEGSVNVTGRCGKLREATISGSPINAAYAALKRTFDEQNTRYATLVEDIEVIQDERVNREAKEAMAALDREKRELVGSLLQEYPLLGRIASLNTYLSWYSAEAGKFTNQLDHYTTTYFQLVDFADPGYDDLSWTYEGGRSYANNLLKAIPSTTLADVLLAETSRWPVGSRARFLARSGTLAALVQGKHPATVKVGDSIIEEYASRYPAQVDLIRRQTAGLRSFTIGAPAPLFTAPTLEGEELSLESLRGKVVLLDFWASWCGPCRRENPNVVRVYNRFKDQGFEILGISLDDRRERWEQAVAADKLEWLHVSDLQGWKSAYGQLYGVTSIPQTVLLDRDGNILARNLRGPDLERRLEEVFGGNPD